MADRRLREWRISGSDAGARIRGMGCHEAYQLAMHTLDQYRGTVVACRYCPPPSLVCPETLATLKAKFYDAIVHVVLAQPHLQVGITGENSNDPGFVRLDSLDLRNHVNWISVNDSSYLEPLYLEIMQDQLDSRYNNLSTRPGWKVSILHKAGVGSLEVLYVWNHVHHDGMSGKIFHQQLLRNLNENFTKNKEPVLNVLDVPGSWTLNLPDPSHELPPNPEVLTSWPMTPGSNIHAFWAPIQASPFTTRFRNFTIPNDTVTRLVRACRLHHTTLTGLVQALILVVFTSALRDMEGFACRTPYDLRHILPSNTPRHPWVRPKELMCNYVSVVDHEFDTELVATIRSKISAQGMDVSLTADVMNIVWCVSAQVRRDIEARLNLGIQNDMIGIMKFVSDWRTQQRTEAHKTRHLSWLVTNLGVLDGGIINTDGQEEGWFVRRAELVLSAEVPSAALSVSIMTVKGGEMCITCSWQDCVVDLALVERLTGDLERWLNEIGS